jgi:16S rRNA G966 N2-methylase RsmD
MILILRPLKVMFLNRKKQRWFRHYFADPPYALDQKILKNCIINFRKNTLNDGMMIIEHSKYTS